MTTHSASGLVSTTSFSDTFTAIWAVRAGTYEIEINKIDYGIPWVDTFNDGIMFYAVANPTMGRSPGGSISGGTSIAIGSLNQRSGTASATARFGIATTVSGTGTDIVGAPSVTATGVKSQGRAAGSNSSYSPPYDLTVSPGSAFYFSFNVQTFQLETINLYATIYFEERRESWPYS